MLKMLKMSLIYFPDVNMSGQSGHENLLEYQTAYCVQRTAILVKQYFYVYKMTYTTVW